METNITTRGPKELQEEVLARGLCVSCGACVGLCPYVAHHRGRIVWVFPCTLEQGRCHAFCPKTDVDLDALSREWWGRGYQEDPLGEVREIWATRAGSRLPSGNFQAGGTVSALTAYALSAGWIRAAVLTQRQGVEGSPRVVRRWEEVMECSGVTYAVSPTLLGVHRALGEGEIPLGVVGTPCQVMGLGRMRISPLDEGRVSGGVRLVIGLFCTWALEERGLSRLLGEVGELGGIQRMDLPPPPSEILEVETPEGKHLFPLSRVRPLIPRGCLFCPDMTAQWADLSAGVMEGEPGWNTLIVRSHEGQRLLEEATKEGWLERRPPSPEKLEHLREAARNKRRRALLRARKEGFLGLEESPSILRFSPAAMNALLKEGET